MDRLSSVTSLTSRPITPPASLISAIATFAASMAGGVNGAMSPDTPMSCPNMTAPLSEPESRLPFSAQDDRTRANAAATASEGIRVCTG